jgi:hypothetical protein
MLNLPLIDERTANGRRARGIEERSSSLLCRDCNRALRLAALSWSRYLANANEFLSGFFTVTQKRELKPFFRNRINYGEIRRE